MNKMNPEIKARWIAALRSGEYKQTKSELRSAVDKFCCLGVLCDLHAQAGLGLWDGFRYREEGTIPPTDVAVWAGLPVVYPNPDVWIDGKCRSVAEHNDQGATFAEIADAIEEQL